MPKVPVESPQFTTQVQGPQMPYAREFGKEGAAIAMAGQEVEQAGFQIGDKLAQAAAVDQAQQSLGSQQIASEKKWNDLKLSSPDGFIRDAQGQQVLDKNTGKPRSIADEYHDWANEQYMSAQEKMNFRTQEIYKSQAAPYFMGQSRQYELEAQQKNHDYFVNSNVAMAKAQGGAPENAPQFVMKPTLSPSLDENGVARVDQNGKPVMEMRPIPDATTFYGNLQTSLANAATGVGKTLDPFQLQQHQTELGHTMTKEASEVIVSNILAGKKLGAGDTTQQIKGAIDLFRGDDPQSKERASAGKDANGNLVLPTFSSKMDPDFRERQIDRLIRAIPKAKETDDADLKRRTEEVKSWAESGGDFGAVRPSFSGILQEWRQRAMSDPQKYGTLAAQQVTSMIVGQYMGEMKKPDFMSGSDNMRAQAVQKFANQVMQDSQAWAKGLPNSQAVGATARNTIRAEFSRIQDKITAEKKEDPVAFAWQARPDMLDSKGMPQSVLASGGAWQNFYNRSVGPNRDTFAALGQGAGPVLYQKAAADYTTHAAKIWSGDGIKYRAPIDKGMSADLGSYLTNITPAVSEKQKGDTVAAMVRTFGHYYPQNVEQMIEDKKLPAGMGRIMALHATDDPTAQMKLMSVLTGGPVERENFKSMIAGNSSVTQAQAEKAVSDVAAPWVSAWSGVDAYNNAQAENQKSMNDAIFTGMVKNLRDKGTTQPSLSDVKDAAKNSYNDLVGNFGHPITVGQTGEFFHPTAGATNQSWLPKYYRGTPVDPDLVRANLNYDKTHVEQFHPIIPTVGGKPSIQADEFIPMVNKTAMAVPSQNPPGHFIKYTNAQGQSDWLMQAGPNGQPRRVFIPLRASLAVRPIPTTPASSGRFDPQGPTGGRAPQSASDGYEEYKRLHAEVDSGSTEYAIRHSTGGGPVTPETDDLFHGTQARQYPWHGTGSNDPNDQGKATDIMAAKVMGFPREKRPADYTQAELNKFDELRGALKNSSSLPKWLNEDQKKQVKQFYDHSRK